MAALELAQEQKPEGEDEAVEKIVSLLQRRLSREYPVGTRTLRDAHPKQHGLLKAEFIVESSLPVDLRIGLFSESRTFPAWVRFSNMSDPPQPDIKADSRGMAIKLMGVEGEKLLDGERHAGTQDFVLMSSDFFVTKDVKGFADLVEALERGTFWLLWHLITHARLLILFLKVRQHCASPLEIAYGSTTPYLFGPRAVKYSVRPSLPAGAEIPAEPSDNYLRDAMVRHLSKDEARFDFLVQFQTDPIKMPIEDPRVLWSESLSPPLKIATLRIPPQIFDRAPQDEYGDNLSFTPWHCLPTHRPLGGINRGRRVIYETMSAFRHSRNGASREEPEGWVTF